MPPEPLDRSHKSAISILNSRRRLGRPDSGVVNSLPGLSRIPNANGALDLRGTPSIIGMKKWLHQIGHSMAEIDSLNILHVAGTKGKESTCAFIESFLRVFGNRTGFPRKTGLYTSPHLIYPEERIRINFQPITRDLFANYLFEVWDALAKGDGNSQGLPHYLQLIALISFHAFIKEGVDVAIVETHHGGEYDATNVIEHPVATVITSLGMDHVKQLGPTIENIAWHKAGIVKHGSEVFASVQEDSAAEVLRSRASEKGNSIQFIENDASLPADILKLRPYVQRLNCSVALAAVRHFLEENAPQNVTQLSSSDISRSIAQFSWPGRFQSISKGAFKWFLDSAHNEMSITKAAELFIENSQEQSTPSVRVLIFSQISQQRDVAAVLECLATALSTVHIHYVIFTTYDPKQDFHSTTGMVANLGDASQKVFGEIWKKMHKDSRTLYMPNVQKALKSAREIGNEAGGTDYW